MLLGAEVFLGLSLAHHSFHPIGQIICGAKVSRGQGQISVKQREKQAWLSLSW